MCKCTHQDLRMRKASSLSSNHVLYGGRIPIATSTAQKRKYYLSPFESEYICLRWRVKTSQKRSEKELKTWRRRSRVQSAKITSKSQRSSRAVMSIAKGVSKGWRGELVPTNPLPAQSVEAIPTFLRMILINFQPPSLSTA